MFEIWVFSLFECLEVIARTEFSGVAWGGASGSSRGRASINMSTHARRTAPDNYLALHENPLTRGTKS